MLYENLVIESRGRSDLPFPIVAIYPREGTFWSDHPVAIVNRPWVTPEHKEAAAKYVEFLLARPQQERALALGFRPGDPSVALSAPIDAAHGVDPAQPQTTLDVPPPAVMNSVIELWRRHKKHSHVVLVFDVSGSMGEQNKIVGARDGARQLLAMLGDQDSVSLLPFSSEVGWARQNLKMADGRAEADGVIASFFPQNATRLYDAIATAYRHLESDPRPGRISAIVVLTDGKDQTSQSTNLDGLLSMIRADNEKASVRIFTIAYGSDAEVNVLKSISEATQARSYKGTSQNIREVFKEIATFF